MVVFYDDAQGTLEALVFLAFPMEVDADGDTVQFERGCLFVFGFEEQFVIKAAFP